MAKSSHPRRGRGRAGAPRGSHRRLAIGALAAVLLGTGALLYRSDFLAAASHPPSKTEPKRISAAKPHLPHIAEAVPVAEPAAPEPAPAEKAPQPAAAPKLAALKMSAKQWQSLDEIFARQLRRCWTAPIQTDEDRPFVAKIKVDFGPDGSLIDKPTLLNVPADPAWKAQAAGAMKALKNCRQLNIPASFQPFYAEWKTRIINFDPTL